MKNLTEKEMETVNGGFNWGCFFSVAGLVLSGIEYAATPVTGGFGAVVGSLTYAVSIGGIATSCE